MVQYITMPRLSDTMEEGTIVKWHKSIGENILEGDLLVEIETDKAIQEFESEFNGYLLYKGIPDNGIAKVDTLIAIIADSPNLDINNILSLYIKKKNSSINNINKKLLVSPLAKIMARNKSISLKEINGSGPNGRIIKKDIENYQLKIDNKLDNPVIESLSDDSITLISNRVINSSIRKIIAKRLSESKFTAPHYYLIIEIYMKNSINFRSNLNSSLKEKEKISFNDLIIKAVALSLKKNTSINSSWTNDKIIHHNNINIGVAVATNNGLIVPVIKRVDKKTLLKISKEIKEKIKKAKLKKLSQLEIKESTFTISNLGMFGIESFTSIINLPNSCILSVGAILEKPIIKNGIIINGNLMKLSLACDHRIIDGDIGSSFLNDIKYFLENPITLLL